jgi:hypothetical protein
MRALQIVGKPNKIGYGATFDSAKEEDVMNLPVTLVR